MRLAVALLAFATLSAPLASNNGPNSRVVVHEWGTFTSVAGPTGQAVPWAPLRGAPDLPCFVETLQGSWKPLMTSLVRMETPVLYFYSPRPTTLSVKVGFPDGWITEWYPSASRNKSVRFDWPATGPRFLHGGIEWDRVEVLPGDDPQYPASAGASHYFAARETDAAPLRIGDQREKMIFYRGIASFQPPLRAQYDASGKLEIRNTGQETIPVAILFENQRGRAGYRVVREVTEAAAFDPPELTAQPAVVHAALQEELVSLGLYEREAKAMIETWRDSWFEEGTRVFYLMPRAAVDRILPLTILPAPAEIARAFVGRVEVLSPFTRTAIENAVSAGDKASLAKLGRFLQPFTQRMRFADRSILAEIQKETDALYNAGGCVR